MERVFTFDPAVFLYFQTVGRILFILLRRVSRNAGKTAVLAFGALKRHHDAVAFSFCHFLNLLPKRDYFNNYYVLKMGTNIGEIHTNVKNFYLFFGS